MGEQFQKYNNTELVLCALKDAVQNRGVKNLIGCIHHTDSDVRYCSEKYTQALKEYKMEISMCLGNAYENAHAKIFF